MRKRVDGMDVDVSPEANARRYERLITALETATNSLARTAQLIEARETKRVMQKAKRGRIAPPRKCEESDERILALADQATRRLLNRD